MLLVGVAVFACWVVPRAVAGAIVWFAPFRVGGLVFD